jgi:hypothetical protein
MTNGISKYMEKYFDTQFGHLRGEIKDVKKEVKGIKVELQKNGKCLIKLDRAMGFYKFRMKWLTIAIICIIVVLLLGVFNGIELITKGTLSFFK